MLNNEIGNFVCVRCKEKILHKDLKKAYATLSRNRKGVVFICNKCYSKPKQLRTGIEKGITLSTVDLFLDNRK